MFHKPRTRDSDVSAASLSPASLNGLPPGAAVGAYGTPFWFAYAANTCLMTAISLLFRYHDFVAVLGGGEWELGWIVGLGMVGSLMMRLAQGMGIDRFGPRHIWVWSVAAFAVVCFAHRWIDTVHGPGVYLLHIAFRTSIAGAFGASITYVSHRVPVIRVAEMIGTLGTSGFLGIVLGALLGDYVIFGEGQVTRLEVDRMFLAATLLGAASFGFAWISTLGGARPQRRRKAPLLWILKRYHPGTLLLVGIAVGMGVSLPGTFLRPFAASIGITGIAVFFGVYSLVAFVTRMATRTLPQRIGIRPMIFLGLSCLVSSMFLYLLVETQWQLVIPAVVAGMAHAFLFPSVTAGGSTSFPVRYRGLGVTLMLAMFDFGNFIGAPLASMLLGGAKKIELPPYPTMFVCMGGVLGAIGLTYALSSRREGARGKSVGVAQNVKAQNGGPEASVPPAKTNETAETGAPAKTNGKARCPADSSPPCAAD